MDILRRACIITLIGLSWPMYSQCQSDTIIGKSYYFPIRIGADIRWKELKYEMYDYSYNDLWKIVDRDYRSICFTFCDCYMLVNQKNDTGWISKETIDNASSDEFALITPKRFQQLSAKYGKAFPKLMYGKVSIGMSSKQVRLALGPPDDINSTETRYTYSEQWVYSIGSYSQYYYFENGKLNSIQR